MSSSVKRMRRPTIEAKLERDVQEQFEKGLSDFIREKAEAESLYDHEIADILGANPNWIRQYRKRFGIRMGKRFPRRFENIHGKDAVERFKGIIEDPDSSLADVARDFGFTRENARQLYKKIYGFPYTETLRKKQELKKRSKPKQKVGKLWKAAETMKSRGLDF